MSFDFSSVYTLESFLLSNTSSSSKKAITCPFAFSAAIFKYSPRLQLPVFKDGYKLSVEGTTGKVEEFTLNGKDIDQKENAEKFKDLINELEIFKGSENFKLPDLQ